MSRRTDAAVTATLIVLGVAGIVCGLVLGIKLLLDNFEPLLAAGIAAGLTLAAAWVAIFVEEL